MKYTCEFCNKQYDTAEGAEQCELTHKKEVDKETAKADAENKISEAVNAFTAKYKEFPRIILSDENVEYALSSVAKSLDRSLDRLFDAFFNSTSK